MLEDGGIILSDRYRASSFAYQLMAGVPLEYITMIHEEQGNQLEIPDFTFYLDLSAEAAIERTRARTLTEKVNSEIFEVLEFQQRVRAQYKKIIERGLKYLGRVTVIDAANSEEKVASDIQEAFRGIYTKWISRKSE
jgi:thymidylate kinase